MGQGYTEGQEFKKLFNKIVLANLILIYKHHKSRNALCCKSQVETQIKAN